MHADILYVEDNPDHAELVLRHLERRQVRERVVHVADGELALAHLQDVRRGAAAWPLLVLLDLRLPRIDGLEVLRVIKESEALRNIPVVVFTTSAAARDVDDAAARHANSYLVKPDDVTRLGQMLDSLATYWLTHNHVSTQGSGAATPRTRVSPA